MLLTLRNALLGVVATALAYASVCAAISDDEIERMREKLRSKFPTVQTISAAELVAKLNSSSKDFVLIDTRAKKEFDVSHLRSALLFDPESDSLEELAKPLSPNSEIVTYCSVGYRSSMIAEKLMNQGFSNVRSLRGGIFEWANSGYPIYRESNGAEVVAESVHPFDKKWGQLLDQRFHPEVKIK